MSQRKWGKSRRVFVYYESNKKEAKTKKNSNDAMSLYNYRYYYINTDRRCRNLLKTNEEIIVQYENGGNFIIHK